jgi:hypothetical protein
LWRYFGLSAAMNEAAPGIMLALAANFIATHFPVSRSEPVEKRQCQ